MNTGKGLKGKTCLTALALVAATVVEAKDLHWWGYGSVTWEVSGAAAFRELPDTETKVKFENGANAFFDSAYIHTGSTYAKINSNLTISNLVFDLSRDFTITNTAKKVVTAASFVKKGIGTLWWMPCSAGLELTTGDGKIKIEKGKLVLQPTAQSATLGTIGNDTTDGTTFEIEDGGEFSVRYRNCLSGTGDGGANGVNVNVHTGGVFSLVTPSGVASTTAGDCVQNFVRSLWLDGGTLSIEGNGWKDYGIINITEKLAFSGPTPYVLSAPTGYTNPYIFVGNAKPVEINVADITKDAQADATFAGGYPLLRRKDTQKAPWNSPTEIRKTGAGTLTFAAPLDVKPTNLPKTDDPSVVAIDGDIAVEEGTLSLMTNSCVYGGFDRTITVEDGATLHIGWHNPFHVSSGAASAAPAHVATAIDVKKGGKLIVQRPRSVLEDGSVAFGPLTFEDATFDFSGFYTGSSALGVIQLTDKVWFKKGTNKTPYCFYQTNKTDVAALPPNPNTLIVRSAILLKDNPEICVEDITGDDGEDVVLAHNLANYSKDAVPSGFVKTGEGTLRLGGDDFASDQAHGNYNGHNGFESSFAGDVVVSNGTLQIGPDIKVDCSGKPLLGLMTTNMAARTITVAKDGTLYMPNRNVFYGSAQYTNLPYNCTFVIQGKYRQDAGQINILPNLTVDGGEVEFPGVGIDGYGVMMVAGTFKVTGSSPCRIMLPTGVLNNTRSFFAINGYPETTFDVGDVTGDGAADLEFTRALSKNTKMLDYKVGFVKRGAGTMRIAGKEITDTYTVDGDVKVEEGTLLADADNLANARDILVSAGAALGGTGTVEVATLADGAKLTVRTSSKKALDVTERLTLGATGTIEIVNDANVDLAHFKSVPIISGSGVARMDLTKWSVTLDGVPVSAADLRLTKVGNVLKVGANVGLVILVQ